MAADMTEKMTPDESAVVETDVAAKIAKFVTTSSWHSLEELQRAISAIINATGRNAPMTPSNDGQVSANLTEEHVVALLKTHLRLWQLFTLDGQYDKTIIKPESLGAAAKAIIAAVKSGA